MDWKRVKIDGFITSYVVNMNGEIRHIYTDKVKSAHKNQSGYLMVNIYYNHSWHLVSVHRIVALMFIPNPLNKPEVNHIDGNKLNNSVSNLEWVTHQENVIHATKTGLNPVRVGFNAANNKYTESQISNVIKMLKKDPSNMSKISRKTGIPIDTVFLIKSGRRYNELSSSLGFTPIEPKHRFDFNDYVMDVKRLVKLGLSNKEIREKIPIPISPFIYNYNIRKIRKSLIK